MIVLPTQQTKQVGTTKEGQPIFADIVIGPLIQRTCSFRITHGEFERPLDIRFEEGCHGDYSIVMSQAGRAMRQQ